VATKKTFICVGCPLGCEVTLTLDAKGKVIGFEGNRCKEGEKYVMEEYKNPVRTLTATVLTRGSSQPLLAVRTARPIGKTLLKKGMGVIARTTAEPPVKAGDVIVPNLLGSGVDLVASSDLSS
jgi:CxxC motif-containing protein